MVYHYKTTELCRLTYFLYYGKKEPDYFAAAGLFKLYAYFRFYDYDAIG